MCYLYKSEKYANVASGFEKNSEAVRFEVRNGNEYAVYNFIKRDLCYEIPRLSCGQIYDVITPFDYGGIYYSSPQILPLFFEKFSTWCAENNIVSEFIRFDPCGSFDFSLISRHMDIAKINDLIYIDLQVDFWLQYSKGRKSDIAKAKKLQHSVAPVGVDIFYPIYFETMQSNLSSDYFYFDKDALGGLVNEGFARVFAIYMDGEPFSSIMILDDENHSYYFLGASSRRTISFDANALLLHEVAILLKNEGRSMFFLGGGRQGVYDFKSRFSKKTLPYYIGKKVHNEQVYNELVKLTGRDENSFFPKYREKII